MNPNSHADDLSGHTALVTGATSGIGFEAAAQLADAGYATVIITGRSQERAQAAATALAERTGRDVFEAVALDLGDADSTQAAAAALAGRTLHALVLNAGIVSGSERKFTSDGIELTFASSVIGHHRLTAALLAAGTLAPDAHIVIAGSEAARGDVPTMNIAHLDQVAGEHFQGDLVGAATALMRGEQPTRFKPFDTYATTKVFTAWWVAALARRLPVGMTVDAVSPGNTPDTGAVRNASFIMRKVMVPMMLRMPATWKSSSTRPMPRVASSRRLPRR
jgi:NAD(P)-dependent dehydrogenase (short-subunit alcohol dehydrogenase family)